jgi:ribA/ribD-fused uncharacterized protein
MSTESITDFHGEHFFLSNFAASPIVLDGETYPTMEHAFQAAKTHDPAERQLIREAVAPASAKHLGKRVTLRADWEQIKLDLMLSLLRQKFADAELRAQLLATGEAVLIEGNTWNDRSWGAVLVKGQWIGKNWLGRLLMQVREEEKEREKEREKGRT